MEAHIISLSHRLQQMGGGAGGRGEYQVIDIFRLVHLKELHETSKRLLPGQLASI